MDTIVFFYSNGLLLVVFISFLNLIFFILKFLHCKEKRVYIYGVNWSKRYTIKKIIIFESYVYKKLLLNPNLESELTFYLVYRLS